MKKYIFTSIIALTMLVSCDDHVQIDESWHSWYPGMVLTTDGSVLSPKEYLHSGKEIESVIFYIDHAQIMTQGIAYAVDIREYNTNYADSLFSMGTSCDINALDGEQNTYILRNLDKPSPVATRATSPFFIPSAAEMKLLFAAKDSVNHTLSMCDLDSIPSTAWFWTSTEVADQQLDRAYIVSMVSGQAQPEDKFFSHAVRPIRRLIYETR